MRKENNKILKQYEISSYVDGQTVYHLQEARNSNIQINLSLDKGVYKDIVCLLLCDSPASDL
jgi:hypothetical protein